MSWNIYNVEDGEAVATWNFEGKVDGNQVHNEYTEWNNDGNDFWRITNDQVRNGLLSSTVQVAVDGNYTAYYDIPSTDQSRKITLTYYYYNTTSFGTAKSVRFKFLFKIAGIVVAEMGITYYTTSGPIFSWSSSCKTYTITGSLVGSTTVNSTTDVNTWHGFRVIVDLPNKILQLWVDRGDSGNFLKKNEENWVTGITKSFDRLDFNVFEVGLTGTWGYEKIFIDDMTLTSDVQREGNKISISKMWFTQPKENVGHGYMIIPDQDVDFSNYYNLQEQEIIIVDPNGNIRFRGEITKPTTVIDGVRLDFREITYQLIQRTAKREGVSEKGTLDIVGSE